MGVTTSEEALVLPRDVVVAPLGELPVDVRYGLTSEAGDYYVTRPRTRTVTTVVDADTASLLERFRTPATIVDAVIAFSEARGSDPRATLEDAFEALRTLVDAELLLPAAAALARPVTASLDVGGHVDDIEIRELVHLVADTETYRGRTADGSQVAVKLVTRAAPRHVAAALAHERTVLSRLDGRANPTLLGAGHLDGQPYLVTEWLPGADLVDAAAEARLLPARDSRAALVGIAIAVLEAYRHLHAQQVVHGDVHPRNVRVGPAGDARILDYGLSSMPGLIPATRGGVDLYQSPETMRASLDAGAPAVPTATSEQYSIAALLYFLLTGGHTHSFAVRPKAMSRQVVEDPPLRFAAHGVTGLAAVERVLGRALAKDPAARHGGVDELTEAFVAAARRDLAAGRPGPPGRHRVLRARRDRLIDPYRLTGPLFAPGLAAPTASLTYGDAGVAFAVLKVSVATDDPALLAAADAWATRASGAIRNPGAFWNAARGIVPEVFGRGSLFHHAAGVHAVAASVGGARLDREVQQAAIDRFVDGSRGSSHRDVAFGRAGLLLGCAALIGDAGGTAAAARLQRRGADLCADLAGALTTLGTISGGGLTLLGAAHGWSGCLFAILRWCAASGSEPPPVLFERLVELRALGEPSGRGLRWPRVFGAPPDDSVLSASWCNGAAGHAFLWAYAHRFFPREGFDRAAEMAAWTAYDAAQDAPGDLCCGLAGRAYALLATYRLTGDRTWLLRAERLSRRAADAREADPDRVHSLYHGRPGTAAVLADLLSPDLAGMPWFEGGIGPGGP